MAITHAKVLTGADGTHPDRAQPSDWNDDHVIDLSDDPGAITTTGLVNLSGGSLILPTAAPPSPTAEGSIAWGSATDAIYVGDGAATKVVYPLLTGTWTPDLGWTTSDGDFSKAFSTQAGYYRRIGDMVTCWVRLTTSTFTHTTASGYLKLTGLPFAIGANSETYAAGWITGWTFGGLANGTVILSIRAGQTYIIVWLYGSGGAYTPLDETAWPTGGAVNIYAHFSYLV